MENVTHTLIGLMLARTGLEKTTPRGAAMMMLAANVPDIDGIYYFVDAQRYVEYHRTYTHTLLFMPVMALLPMLLVRAKFSWCSYAAAMIAVLSHLIVDWVTFYGIPMLLPFSDHRFRLDIVRLYDLWIAVILIGALAATAVFEVARIGKPGAARRGFAWGSLLLFLAFGCGRLLARQRAVETLSAHSYEGARPLRVTALPDPVHPLVWRGIVEGDGFTALTPVDLTREFDPGAARLYHSAPRSPALEAALATRPFQVFTKFSQVPFATEARVPEGIFVQLTDLRFGTPEAPGFVTVSALVDPNGKVLRAGFGR
ncbi:MAG: metal-dependent hydrolase [Bryobacterales bacterium]|nr:metal-dependent hydrolase [Bryobacterales bacterium]